MKKSISLVILIAGIIVALLAGAGTYAWLQKRATVQSQTLATQPVVVAATDISWGKVLDATQVKTVNFLKASLPQGSFMKPSEVEGRTLLYPVKAGEPLFETQLAPTSVKVGGVSAIISKNKRAMAVKVDKVIGVSGFINPGNHVDVLVTVEGITKTVLENVLVLTVGQQMEMTGNQEKPVPVDVITMEVTSVEAEKLALAASAGKVMLALRNPTDTDSVVTRGVTVPVLLASLGAPAATAKPVFASATRKRVTMVKTSTPVEDQCIYGESVIELKFE